MKQGIEHRVPLSDASREVLRRARARGTTGLIFPSADRKRPLSDMSLMQLLRRTGLAGDTTVHGFRASFRTWAMEQTDVSWSVGESALAHSLGDSTEQAYARSDLLERRRVLMAQWGAYATGESETASNAEGVTHAQ